MIDTSKMPYTVELDDNEICHNCGRGGMWYVVGPNGVAIGIIFGDKDEAQERADELSRAYLAGAQAALGSLRNA